MRRKEAKKETKQQKERRLASPAEIKARAKRLQRAQQKAQHRKDQKDWSPEDAETWRRRGTIFCGLCVTWFYIAPFIKRQAQEYTDRANGIDLGEWSYHGELREYRGGQMSPSEQDSFRERASELAIDQARRVETGGLLIEGCPPDDPDRTARFYCGVYHPLPAGDPAAAGAVSSRGVGRQKRLSSGKGGGGSGGGGAQAERPEKDIALYKGFPVWRNTEGHFLFHSARVDPGLWYLSTMFTPEEQLSKAHTAMAPVFAVPTVKDADRCAKRPLLCAHFRILREPVLANHRVSKCDSSTRAPCLAQESLVLGDDQPGRWRGRRENGAR
jgi:hypothetical protein